MSKEEQHIPLFPLNIFLLPGEQLPLHIFELRYRELIEEAEHTELRFGLPFKEEELDIELVSVCRLVKVSKRYQTGASDIIIEAEEFASLSKFEPVYPKKRYPGGYIKVIENKSLLGAPSDALKRAFIEYVKLRFGSKLSTAELMGYCMMDIAASIAIGNTDKIKLLQLKSADQHDAMLVRSLRYLNLLLIQEQCNESGFMMN